MTIPVVPHDKCMIRNDPAIYPSKSTKRTFNSKDDKTIAEDFNRVFESVGHSTVNKIQSVVNKSDLTLNANYFMPRLHPLSAQFILH